MRHKKVVGVVKAIVRAATHKLDARNLNHVTT